MKVLALSVSAGAGHAKAAEAIKKGLNKYYADAEVEIIDTLKYINPMIDKVVVGSYLSSLKRTPYIYSRLYAFADRDDVIAGFSEVVNDVLSLKLKGLIEESSPDIIVCTHPFPLEMMSILKKKSKVKIPVMGILTDYAPHSFWIHSHIEAYVIPHEDFVDELIEKGVERERIYPLGIPVDEDLMVNHSQAEVREEFGLDKEKLTLLMMGGGLGMGNMKNMLEVISLSRLDVQIFCVAGRNSKLKGKLTEISERSDKKIIIFDYTNRISELMSASDILISKPGGLTISESLLKGLPIVITSTIPGQEEENANYLLNNGVAARLRKKDDIIGLLSQLTGSKLRLRHMKEMALEKSKPNSVKDICQLIAKMAENK